MDDRFKIVERLPGGEDDRAQGTPIDRACVRGGIRSVPEHSRTKPLDHLAANLGVLEHLVADKSASITNAPILPKSDATWLLPPPIAPVKPITGTAPCFHRSGSEANEKTPKQDDMVLLETTIWHDESRESTLGLEGGQLRRPASSVP